MKARPTRMVLLVISALLLLRADPAAAQIDPVDLAPGDQLYQIQLVDGSLLIARVSAVDADRITLTTSGGTRVEVQRSQIGEVRPAVGQVVDGVFWPDDPNDSRLFFTATGRTLESGTAYAGTYLIVLPFVGFGLTDRFTIAAGAPVLLGEFEPFYLAPKLQVVRAADVTMAVGALHFIFRGEDFSDGEDVGIAYGVATFGSSDRGLTLGVGFGYSGSDFSSQPVGMVGGEVRSSRRVKLITENYILPDDTGLVLSGGVRLIGDRFSADLGIAAALGDGGGGCCVPLVSVAYQFGGGR